MGAMQKRRSNILLSLHFLASARRSGFLDRQMIRAIKLGVFLSFQLVDLIPPLAGDFALPCPLPQRSTNRLVQYRSEFARDTFLITTASALPAIQ
jgi:hypothetical protein